MKAKVKIELYERFTSELCAKVKFENELFYNWKYTLVDSL